MTAAELISRIDDLIAQAWETIRLIEQLGGLPNAEIL